MGILVLLEVSFEMLKLSSTFITILFKLYALTITYVIKWRINYTLFPLGKCLVQPRNCFCVWNLGLLEWKVLVSHSVMFDSAALWTGDLQAGIVEWVAISFSLGSSQPCNSALQAVFCVWTTRHEFYSKVTVSYTHFLLIHPTMLSLTLTLGFSSFPSIILSTVSTKRFLLSSSIRKLETGN